MTVHSLEQRQRMGAAIVDFEARRDAAGRLMVYRPPANDGGGLYEVAGINVRYHPETAAKLRALIEQGRHQEAAAAAADYVVIYTNVVASWHADPGVEFFLRDCAFNRGPKGAARILQRAVGVVDDGEVGPQTRAAIVRLSASDLLTRLRTSREDYERNVVGYRANFWNGLVHRWDKALVAARQFATEAPAEPRPQPAGRNWLKDFIDAILGIFRGKAPPPATSIEPPWLTLARKDVGFHEVGANRGIERFIDGADGVMDNKGIGKVGDPYCAIALNYWLEMAGFPGTRSAMARSFEQHKNFVQLGGPALGAIATFWRGSPSAGSGHVCLYVGTRADGRHLGLGANQSDSVNIAPMDMARHTGWWWPKNAPLPKGGSVRTEVVGETGSET
jgi:uncharacterized protein (TIGR02594 family)